MTEKDHAGCGVRRAWGGGTAGRRIAAQVGDDRGTGQSRAVRIDTKCEPLSVGVEDEKEVKDPPSFRRVLIQMDEAVTNQMGTHITQREVSGHSITL